METSNKIIKVGATVNWRGSWGKDAARTVEITGIELCERERQKYGIEMKEVWAKDKDRCLFHISTGNWAYGFQIDLMPESLTVSDY